MFSGLWVALRFHRVVRANSQSEKGPRSVRFISGTVVFFACQTDTKQRQLSITHRHSTAQWKKTPSLHTKPAEQNRAVFCLWNDLFFPYFTWLIEALLRIILVIIILTSKHRDLHSFILQHSTNGSFFTIIDSSLPSQDDRHNWNIRAHFAGSERRDHWPNHTDGSLPRRGWSVASCWPTRRRGSWPAWTRSALVFGTFSFVYSRDDGG